LINRLASVKALRVISRTSVMQYKAVRKPLPEIARALNVAAILEGSVLRAGNRVRITVQLVDGRSDVHLWARSFERNLDDVLSMQAEVAEAVVVAVGLQLTAGEKAKLLPAHTDVPAAHDAYLQGRYRWNTRTRRGLNESIAYYRQAIAADPKFAPAYVGIADSYAIMMSVGWLTRDEGYPVIKRAATAAVQIDPDLAEGHQMLAEVREEEWDWAGAEREYIRAIELNTGLARAHQWYALLLIALNRPQDAIGEIKRAIALDPLGVRLYATESRIFYLARQFDQAFVPLQPLEAMNVQPVLQHLYTGIAYFGQRRYDRAITELQTVVQMEPDTPDSLAYLASAYALAGRKSDALETFSAINRLHKTKNVDPALTAMIWTSLGDRDRALHSLDEAYAAHSPIMSTLAVDPIYDPLRQDPRFTDLVRRVGLPVPGA